MKHNQRKIYALLSVTLLIAGSMALFSGCNKFLEIPLPTNTIAGDGAFVTDNSASGVVTGILYSFYNGGRDASPLVLSGAESIGYRAGLYSDELQNLAPANQANLAFYTNNIQGANVLQWSYFYKIIYQSNLAIEGIIKADAALVNKSQWLGEATFCRAFSYYYLVNLFGDVPLLTTSKFDENKTMGRTPQADVYKQILNDLLQAKSLLSSSYKDGNAIATNLRTRPNRLAATAMLARVYLALGDWANAEIQASEVISSTAPVYQLVAPSQTFLVASNETVWAIAPTGAGFVREFTVYNNNMPAIATGVQTPTSFQVNASLSQSLKNSFEPNDARFTSWVRSFTTLTPALTYFFPNKYKINIAGGENIVALRLAEQYLIRAEARARLNKLTEAKTDLDAVRARAALAPSPAITQSELITAVLNERKVELFTEFGFRFFDLKRTGQVDAVMTAAQIVKGGTWLPFKQIWPIPTTEITANNSLTQAPGYQ